MTGWQRFKTWFGSQLRGKQKPDDHGDPIPEMHPWVKAIHGPLPKGGVLHRQGGMNRAQRRALMKTMTTRSQRMQIRQMREDRWIRIYWKRKIREMEE